MSFLSGLKVFGSDILKAFAWFGSPGGQAVIGAEETAVEAAFPVSAPIISIFNTWAAKIYNIEAIAVAAGKATGSGADKSAAVVTSIVPNVTAYAKAANVKPRTPAQLKTANDAAVAFINAMTEDPEPTPAPLR